MRGERGKESGKRRQSAKGVTSLKDTKALIIVAAGSGTIVRNIALPFAASSMVGVGQSVDVIPETGHVLVSGKQADGQHHIYRYNNQK